MEKDGIAKKLEKITQKIITISQPEKIILFGSYASGNPTADSDVDLFVIKDTDEDKRERFFMTDQAQPENSIVEDWLKKAN